LGYSVVVVHNNNMKTKIPKYQQLAQQVIDKISSNVLHHGDKLPSLRLFSSQHHVSMNTAVRCYEFLQDSGAVKAIPKSGFVVQAVSKSQTFPDFPMFNGRVTSLSSPIFNQTAQQSVTHQANAIDKPLLSAQLSPNFLPVANLKQSFNRFFHTHQLEHLLYGSYHSGEALANSLSEHFLKQGFALNADSLQITNGCIDAVATALNVVSKPGDTIAINSPCFNGLLELLALLDRKVIEIPSTEQGIDIEQLQSLAENNMIKACLFTANFQNPTGHSLSLAQKQWLAHFAEKYRLPIIEDDVFIELHHNYGMPLPIKHWDTKGWVLWCGSISKTISPGLRLGWCSAGRYSQAFKYHSNVHSLGVNQPVQQGICDFIDKGHYAKHVKKINHLLHSQMIDYCALLKKLLPESAVISSPSGGIVIWVQVVGVNTQELVNACESENIYIRSGNIFSTHNVYDDCFRINVGWPLNENIEKQLKYIADKIRYLMAP